MSVKGVFGVRLVVVAFAAAIACIGCGGPSAEQRVGAELQKTGKNKIPVYPLAGHVTIDGGSPGVLAKGRSKLVILLYDLANPDAIPEKWPQTTVDPSGDFQFSHYGIGDGVPPANYVAIFAVLTDRKKKGLIGPDGLKNLYNDPEKNEKNPPFKIDHKSPGKTNYEFDLAISGQEEGTTGPKSVTKIRD